MFTAVLWDFGGVVTSSPFEAFNRYEEEHNLPTDFIRGINATNPETNAWAQLESSEINVDEFNDKFLAEATDAGHPVPGSDVLALLAGDLRPEMVAALKAIKSRYRIGCITNNVKSGEGPGMARDPDKAMRISEVMDLFDVVIESSKVGVRKPNPEIYKLACGEMQIEPQETIFLDDLGINLKPARALGMTTIKVLSANQALTELEALLDMKLQ